MRYMLIMMLASIFGLLAAPYRHADARPLRDSSSLGTSLGQLPMERPGTSMHAGSWDRMGHNLDFRTIAPGHTLVLLNYKGAGVIRQFWTTFPGSITARCQLILQMHWDGEKHPSVRVPLGRFSVWDLGDRSTTNLPPWKKPAVDTTAGGPCRSTNRPIGPSPI